MITSLLIFVGIALALVPVVRPQLALTTQGRTLGLVVLFVIPVLAAVMGASAHMEGSKRTEFCMSCHVMSLHGRSLKVDDDTLLGAVHYQKGAVPRDHACFTCHTTYTMYGDFAAKVQGLRHLWRFYSDKTIEEEKIKTYAPYSNRECLHCHEGTRKFERGKEHHLENGRMAKIRRNEKGCIEKGCHEFVHDVSNIKDQALWVPPPDDTPEDKAGDKKDDPKDDKKDDKKEGAK